MKSYLILILLFQFFFLSAQNVIEWDGVYEIEISDFQSPVSQIGNVDSYMFSAASGFGYSLQMTNAEFMFTKHFNSKVNCSFKRDQSVLVAPDTLVADDIIAFARYEFDLCELYARKLRQRLYEAKSTFSDGSFFGPMYEQAQKEFGERRTIDGKLTEVGKNREKLYELRQAVRGEIEQLSDYCKTCKPSKKKK